MNEMTQNALEQFFGGYFHQDCFLDDPDWQAIIHRFVTSTANSEIQIICDGIRELISGDMSEVQLEKKIMDEYGSCFLVSSEGMTYRDWLSHLLNQLTDEIK